jgi:hypothetical protein
MSVLLPDIVAKVFLGWRRKILRAADAFYARRREGPCRFIQNRSRISVVALKSDAAAGKSKDQLSRDFFGCSIFDFRNNIGTKRTWPNVRVESAMRTIVLQKSQNRAYQLSRQKMKQATIADCYGVRLVKEVAGEFIVR